MTILNGQPIDDPVAAPATTVPVVSLARANPIAAVMGIVALITALVLPLAGIIIGAIGLGMARSTGHRNPLALVGMILGIVFTVAIIAITVWAIVTGANLFTTIIHTCEEQGETSGEFWGVPYTCD